MRKTGQRKSPFKPGRKAYFPSETNPAYHCASTNQLHGIIWKAMVKAAPQSLTTAAGCQGHLLRYDLDIRQYNHYRPHQMTFNHKKINTDQDGNATTNCYQSCLPPPFKVVSNRLGLALSQSTQHIATACSREPLCTCEWEQGIRCFLPRSYSSNESSLL